MLTKADKLAHYLNEQVWLPKPFLSDCEWSCADAVVTHKPLLDNMPLREIDIDQLEHTQLTVDQETVDRYAETGNYNGQVIFKRDGKYYVYDGRHRTLAAAQAGKTSVEAYVFELPDKVPMSIEQFARVARTQPEEILNYMSVDDRRRHGETY